MPADTLSRDIIRICEEAIKLGDLDPADIVTLAEHALSEPTRLASAHAEGVREGIEVALADIAAFDGDLKTSARMNPDYVAARVMRAAAEILTERIRALSPPRPSPRA